MSYLVLETSYYSLKQFKAYKSLEIYNQMVSGLITSVQVKIIRNMFLTGGPKTNFCIPQKCSQFPWQKNILPSDLTCDLT